MNKQIVKKDGPTINKIIKKDGSTVYRANIYLGIDANTGKSVRTSITAKTQKAIKLKASKAINDFQNNGCTRLAKVSCKTFDELIQLWWNNHKLSLKNNTVTSNQNFINSYISPALGAYSISKISTSLIQNQMNIWANNANSSKLYTTGSTKSYSVLLNIITRIFQYGISIGVVTFNPARDVILPRIKRQENKKIKYFGNSELKVWYDFLNSVPNTEQDALLVTLCKLLLSTGMRVNEALALNWSDIDYHNGVVSVTKTLDSKGKLESTPKTRSSARIIDIDQSTLGKVEKNERTLSIEHFENLCEILQTDKKTLLNYHYSSKIIDELKEYPEYKEVLNIVNEQLAYQIQKQESFKFLQKSFLEIAVNKAKFTEC